MSSRPLGKNTSPVEARNISSHGIWLLATDAELFLSYNDFLWFKEAPVAKVLNVTEPRH